jgi:hypothetical protein
METGECIETVVGQSSATLPLPRKAIVQEGERRGERDSEIFQHDEGLRLHSAGRRQGLVRSYLRGLEGRPGRPARRRQGYLRHDQRPRQGVSRKSALEVRTPLSGDSV